MSSIYWSSEDGIVLEVLLDVFAIYDGRRHIGFAKPGDLAWRALIYDDDGGFGGDLHGAHPKSVKFASRPPNFHGGHTCYLFDLDGNLCMTDMDTKSWEKIYSLGDRSLFLGNCCTFTVAAADYPGCKPSCIYYTDELTDVEVNGIYEVEKYLDKDIGLGSLVQPFPKSELMEDFFPPLCWIIPYPL
ncbi:hypothetical protein GOBAR_AA01954 [Gossypium barbadense]|uniref:KIB1-4 beta-propeller domain-containing protein n=1 Tax=Gossypium barbadense TaxID=3634 RepID=A0A2P5YSV6_GOSBA|nr:hypothetical protein GOBAR_AA01954 [Gossypium barbadense]